MKKDEIAKVDNLGCSSENSSIEIKKFISFTFFVLNLHLNFCKNFVLLIVRLLEPKNGFLRPILEFLITKITKRLGASRKMCYFKKKVIQRKFRLPFLFQTT